jgi:hypothetical protein
MEASPTAIAAYEAALPDDPGIERKKMFGCPCAFVNRQMFFGTFDDSLVARVGPDRVEELVGKPGITGFTPTEGKAAWRDYVRLDGSDPALSKALAAEALEWAAKLPAKAKPPKR